MTGLHDEVADGTVVGTGARPFARRAVGGPGSSGRWDAMEDPTRLLRRLNLGREEYCQRLLTMLILDGGYPRWNTSSRPSERGVEFLRSLDRLSFGSSRLDGEVSFVDEFDLPRRDDAEKGCAPDYAVVCDQRLWLIELKTEVASHRPRQIPDYFELAAHHHPDRSLDLTYLTPGMRTPAVEVPEGTRFAHVTWMDVAPIVRDVWRTAVGVAEQVREALLRALDSVGHEWSQWRESRLGDPVALALEVAALTAGDGDQRALDHEAGSLEGLQQLRLAVRDALREGGEAAPCVQPWLWNAQSSGGRPLTRAGNELGYELRFSRSRTVPGTPGTGTR